MMLNQTLATLRMYGIRPSKRSGQHHVVDPIVLEKMVDHAHISHEDVILEIGAGIGNLTRLIAQRAGKVISIERDRRFIRILHGQLRGLSNVQIVHGDALHIELPKFNKVVANLPYGISSDITFRLLEQKFEFAVLMYQQEFAERMVAKPGSDDYSRLTVNTYYRARVELLGKVPPEAFVPQPKVTSAIVRLSPREPPFEVADEKIFFNVIRALFQHRRQRVRNALCHSFDEVFPDVKLRKSQKRELLDKKLPEELVDVRVMDLAPEKFGKITDHLIVNK